MIHLENIHKSFGEKTVLHSIHLTFQPGNIYGIVGENGAGKTTLFRCIAGLEKFDGKIHSEIQPLKEKVGFLMAENFFFDRITGKEYLELMCAARSISTDIVAQNIFDLPLNQYASTYSTGMKKKLAILGLILQKNEVFILDEPFNGIDIQSSMLVSELILELQRRNKTVLLSSHIFSTLKSCCSEILVLKNGTVSAPILPNQYDLLEKDMIKEIVGEKLGVLEW